MQIFLKWNLKGNLLVDFARTNLSHMNSAKIIRIDCKNQNPVNDHQIRDLFLKSSEQIVKEQFREGFSSKDPLAIYREKTIASFFQEIKCLNTVLIRSPPFSGKSSFASLLYSSFVNENLIMDLLHS